MAHSLSLHPEYGLQTVEAQREVLASIAWTCLSPQPALWDSMVCDDWRSEMGGHANPEPGDAETERRLAGMPPAERFARMPAQTFWGPSQQAFAFGGNPLAAFLARLTPDPRVAPTTSMRVLPGLQRKAAGAVDIDAPTPTTEREAEVGTCARQEQVQAARRRLGRALAIGEAYTTTDIFAAVAQQIVWAVERGLTIRACGHPKCGQAFLPETGRHLYCTEHRSGTARSQRSRAPRPSLAPWEREPAGTVALHVGSCRVLTPHVAAAAPVPVPVSAAVRPSPRPRTRAPASGRTSTTSARPTTPRPSGRARRPAP